MLRDIRLLLLLFTVLLIPNSQSQIAAAQAGRAHAEGELSEASENGSFVPLFNGKDLDGWIKRGGTAKYHIDGDAIVGSSVMNTPNTFLCTPRNYGDFELTVELKVDDGLNSGIQIRSEAFDEPQEVTFKNADGKQINKKIPAGRVHGYQVEIDPSDRAYSGGIYDEARRGWLNDLSGEENKAAREAFKRNAWNQYRILAVGDNIKTWVNGVPAADLKDDMTAEGFIALQVHGIGDNKEHEGKQVRWRNLMIREINEEN